MLADLFSWKVKAAIAAVALAAIGGYVLWLRADAARARAEAAELRIGLAEAHHTIDELAGLNARSLAELEQIKADHAAAREVLRRQAAELASAERAYAAALGEMRHADPADDCPLPAPVLSGLRGLRAAAQGGDGHGDPARAGGDAGRDARLSGDSAPPR